MTKKYQDILCPHDGSRYARKAWQEAVTIAKTFGSKIFLLTVIETPNSKQPGLFFGYSRGSATQMDVENFTSQVFEHTNSQLQRLVYEAKKEGIDVEYKVISGYPKKTILEFAKKKNIDLIIIGSQGLGGIKKLVLGSVVSGVVTKSNCPVLIVNLPKNVIDT